MHNQASKPSKDEVKAIDKKLDKCRNQDLNPNSAAYVCLPLLVFHPEVFHPEFDGFDDFTVLTRARYDIETHATKGKSNKYVLYYHSLSQVCYCFEMATGEATLCNSSYIEKS